MLAQDLHTDLDIKLQKINSNATSNIESEEKDWFINNQVDLFLNSRLSKFRDDKRLGLQDDFKRLKDIQPLLKERTLDVDFDIEEGRASLPSFHFDIIDVVGHFVKYCGEKRLNKQYFKNVKFILPYTRFRVRINFVIGNSLELFNTNNYSDSILILDNRKALVDAFNQKCKEHNETVINQFPNTYRQIYYENYREQNLSNNYFLVGDNIENVQIVKFNNDEVIDTITYEAESSFKNYINLPVSKSLPIDIIPTHKYFNQKISFFSSSTLSRSISTIMNRSLIIKNPKYYIAKQVLYKYVEQPNKINVNLNNDLQFREETCKEIINETVQTIKYLLQTGSYDKYVRENKIVE